LGQRCIAYASATASAAADGDCNCDGGRPHNPFSLGFSRCTLHLISGDLCLPLRPAGCGMWSWLPLPLPHVADVADALPKGAAQEFSRVPVRFGSVWLGALDFTSCGEM